MSDATNLVNALVTGGVGAALGSVATAVIQLISKRGESRAAAADRVTNAAGNLADRLDRMNTTLEQENVAMRRAINALADVMDELKDLLPAEARVQAKAAIQAARAAIR